MNYDRYDKYKVTLSPNKFQYCNYYSSEYGKILILKGPIGSLKLYERLDEYYKDKKPEVPLKFMLRIKFITREDYLRDLKYLLENDSKIVNIDTAMVLCNTEREMEICERLGIQCAYVNNNCFQDYDIFNIEHRDEYEVDYTCMSRFSGVKRLHLLYPVVDKRKIRVIASNVREAGDKFPIIMEKCLVNKAKISNPTKLRKYFNDAKYGCIHMSKHEGGSNATIEYLLCGQPILHGKVDWKDARNVWYDEGINSMTVKDNDDMLSAMEEFESMPFNRELIRNNAIKKCEMFRNIFKDTVANVVINEFGDKNFDTEEYFNKTYYNALHKVGNIDNPFKFIVE